MRCDLCNKNCRCSCKGWGCPWCNSTNRQVSFMNDLLKFWVTKEVMKDRLKEIHSLAEKIDSYTAFEYLTWVISEEEFNQLKEQYIPKKQSTPIKKKSEVEGFIPSVNPSKACVFKGNSPRDRCIHCNSIRKYIQWKECLAYKEE
jgi:hypothetical protein